MMAFDLKAMARRAKNIRRRQIVIRDIIPPAVLASNLYARAYRPVVQAWSDGADRIIAEYTRTLSDMTTDAPVDVSGEINSVSDAIDRLILLLTPEIRDWALQVETWFRGKWRGAVLSATGVDLAVLIGAGDARATLETYIQWNASLVKDVSAEAEKRISTAVYDGLRNRTPAREVAKTIREAVDMSRRRSINIASDQLSKISSSLASERRREAGLDHWKWRSSHKKHFRPEHQARDGKVYTDEDAPKDLPGQLPFCGCREQAVMVFD